MDAVADLYKDYQTEMKTFTYTLYGMREGNLAELQKEVAEPARDKFFKVIEKRLEVI